MRLIAEIGALPVLTTSSEVEAVRMLIESGPQAIVSAVRAAPNTRIRFEPPRDNMVLARQAYDDGTRRTGILLRSPVVFEAIISAEFRQKHDVFSVKSEASKEARIVVAYDGAFFAAASDEATRPGLLARWFMQEAFKDVRVFRVGTLGPSPWHERFILTEQHPAAETEVLAASRVSEREIGVVLGSIEELNASRAVAVFFSKARPILMRFYGVQQLRSELNHSFSWLVGRFSHLQRIARELDAVPARRLFKARRLRSRQRSLASRIHDKLASYSVLNARYEHETRELMSDVRADLVMRHTVEYVSSYIESMALKYEVFLGGLEHVRERDLTAAQNRFVMWAAIIASAAALAGSAATTVVQRLFGGP